MTRSTGLLINRRTTLLGAAGLAVAPFAAPHIARAADPIKIGLLLAKTGQIAGQTEYLANGSFLALEQRNKMIMGQPAELVWLDEPSPQAATDIMGKNCNRYTFRLNTPVAVQSRMLAPYALSYGKKWYHITASYAFGQD